MRRLVCDLLFIPEGKATNHFQGKSPNQSNKSHVRRQPPRVSPLVSGIGRLYAVSVFGCRSLGLRRVIEKTQKRDLERKCRENIETLVKVVCCVHSRLASTVDSVLRSDAVQNKLCWLAWYVHNGPPSPKFQILPI